MNIAIIPARGGSKGIPGKNLVDIDGKPLIAHTIESALAARFIDRVIVSTDDEHIASVACDYGAEVPFLRPKRFSEDHTSMIDVLQYFFSELNDISNSDRGVLLQPTSPLRNSQHIDEAMELIEGNSSATVVSVTEVAHNSIPTCIYRLTEEKELKLYDDSPLPLLRQEKPVYFCRNGPAILSAPVRQWMNGQLYGDVLKPYFMSKESSFDIDDLFDLEIVRLIFSKCRQC